MRINKPILFLRIAGFLIFLGMLTFSWAQTTEERSKNTAPEAIWNQSVEGLKSYINGLIEENQQLRTLKEGLERRAFELDKTLQVLKDDNLSLKNQVDSLRQAKASLESQVNSLKNEQCGKTLSVLEDKVKKMDKEFKLCEQDKKEIQNSLSKELERGKLQQKEITQLKNTEADLRKELSKYKKAGGQKETPAMEKENKELKNTAAQLQKENAKLNEQFAVLKKEIDDRSREIEKLKKEKMEAVKAKEMSESLLQLQINAPAKPVVTVSPAAQPKVNHEVSGYKLAKSGKYSEAIEEYQKALEDNPNNKDVYFNMALIYAKLDDNVKAADSYEKVVSLDPKDKEALLNLSKIYDKLSDPVKSKHYYDLYLKLDKK